MTLEEVAAAANREGLSYGQYVDKAKREGRDLSDPKKQKQPKKKERKPPTPHDIICTVCGKTFKGLGSAKYCSYECREVAAARKGAAITAVIEPEAVEEQEEKPMEIVEVHSMDEDVVNHPTHYCRENAIESIDEMALVFGTKVVADFCLCNVWKYRYRAAGKGGMEDLKKSDWYMRKYKELMTECEKSKSVED